MLPADANDALGTLVSFFEQRRHYRARRGSAFRATQASAERPADAVALGSGSTNSTKRASATTARFRSAAARRSTARRRRRSKPIWRPDRPTIAPTLRAGCAASTARRTRRSSPAWPTICGRLPSSGSPPSCKREMNNYSSMVSQSGQDAARHRRPARRSGVPRRADRARAALAALQQPGRLAAARLEMAQWRSEAKELGDLEPRLLKIVLDELRRDLQTRQSRNNAHLPPRQQLLLGRKREGLRPGGRRGLRRAEELGRGGRLPRRVSLSRPGALRPRDRDAVDRPSRRDCWTKPAQSQLVQYLHGQNRHGESIAILLPLVERRPDNMQYRVWLMQAYFCTKQPDQLLALLEANRRTLPQGRPLDRRQHRQLWRQAASKTNCSSSRSSTIKS